MSRLPRFPLLALAGILVATAGWWALALWPLPVAAPPWLERTREICFGVRASGLPTAAGWMALILEPVTLVLALVVVWGGELREGLRGLAAARAGRTALGVAVLLLLAGGLLAARRIAGVVESDAEPFASAPATWRHLPTPPAPLDLMDQHGRRFTLGTLADRPAVITFAYGHCATVCPVVVRDLLAARGPEGSPVLVVVTLDPRRDTPSRLAAVAAQWGLGAQDLMLGGSVEEVERAAGAWGVAWERDSLTGEIVHSTPLFALAGASGEGAKGGGVFQLSASGGGAAKAVDLARGRGR